MIVRKASAVEDTVDFDCPAKVDVGPFDLRELVQHAIAPVRFGSAV